MTIKIHRILKSDLSKVDTINAHAAGILNTSGMTISHFAYSYKATEASLPYEIEVIKEHIPRVKEIEFCVVLREKIDLTATGANGEIIKDVGEDIGKYQYLDQSSSPPCDLPPGFQVLYNGE